MTMQPLKAHVKNGRLVLDEPTDLPEGEVIERVPLVDLLSADEQDDLDETERARLHTALDRARAQVLAGATLDRATLLDRLHAKD